MTTLDQTPVGAMVGTSGHDPLETRFIRTFEASRELVFRAWIDPDHLARWWGRVGWGTAGVRVDPRPGGTFSLVTIGPNGIELPVAGVFRDVVAPERLAYRMTPDAVPADLRPLMANHGRQPLPVMDVTVDFEAIAPRRTRLTVSTRFASVEDLEALAARGATAFWTESLAKLATLVEVPA
jgi:uncharacterized protein YndB with AHSA1/START domain